MKLQWPICNNDEDSFEEESVYEQQQDEFDCYD